VHKSKRISIVYSEGKIDVNPQPKVFINLSLSYSPYEKELDNPGFCPPAVHDLRFRAGTGGGGKLLFAARSGRRNRNALLVQENPRNVL
jgi:hypothetical protein